MPRQLTVFQRASTGWADTVTLTLAAAALLVAVSAQAQTGGGGGSQPGAGGSPPGTSLTPQQVQDAEKTGTNVADAERQLETGEKILTDKDGNPLPKKDLEEKVNNAKKLEKDPTVNDEFKKIVKRAYLKKKRTYLEQDLKDAKGKGDAKAERRAKRQLQELDDELKKVTAAVLVPANQSGFVTFAPIATAVGGPPTSNKANFVFVGTDVILQQTKTTVKLDDAVHLQLKGNNETPEVFYGTLGPPLVKEHGFFAPAPTWTKLDEQAPILPVRTSIGYPLDPFLDRSTTSDYFPKGYSLTLNFVHGYSQVSTDYNWKLGDLRVTYNINPFFTAALVPKANMGEVQQTYMKPAAINGIHYAWTPWQTSLTGNPVFVNGQIPEMEYHAIAWGPLKDFMLDGHLDPGVLFKPAPGLDPATWPTTEAEAIPRLMIPATLIKE